MELSVAALLILMCVLLVLLGGTVLVFLAYSGLLYRPNVKSSAPPIGRCVIAYKFIQGPYSNVGHTFNEIMSLEPKARGIGIYYDNPNTVAAEELRSAVGCILQDAAEPALVAPERKETLSNHGYRIRALPPVESAVVSEFPYTTPVSLLLGPSRVYPLLNQFIEEKGLCAYPMVEVYTENRIHYMAPLSKQVDFFVPETDPENCQLSDPEDESECLVSQSEDELSGAVGRVMAAARQEDPGDQLAKEGQTTGENTSSSGSFEKVSPPLEE